MQTEYDEALPDAFGFNENGVHLGLPAAKALVELEMTRLSAKIRRKPYWWIKCREDDMLNQWREEALAQAKSMTEGHVDYVLEELDGYANLRDEEMGAEVSCYDRIWQSDTLIPPSLKERLIAGVKELEDIPEEEKNWRPHLNNQVLDLVDPSLYPLVYGRTLSYPEDEDTRDPDTLAARLEPPSSELYSGFYGVKKDYIMSRRFQWLPTDFKVSEDGKSVKSISYINNLNTIEHARLHDAIEDLIAAYIPLFERVLNDSIPDNLDYVVPARTLDYYKYEDDGCSPRYDDYSSVEEHHRAYREWEKNRPFIPPGIYPYGYESGSLEKRDIEYTLGGRTIQVIVKLTNIYLTPVSPEYRGGSWQIEGMKNEAIAACGIYYYDEENIAESHLAFRTAVAPPESYEEGDERGCKLAWGIASGDPCVNELGSVVTCQDRCIAFPNTYQHCVSPFRLDDNSKPGHRKIISLFLVDPAIHRPSTTTIPPQQLEWRVSGINANPVLRAGFGKLAQEIVDHIDSMAGGTMTRSEAHAYQLELMDEHNTFIQQNNRVFFTVPFEM